MYFNFKGIQTCMDKFWESLGFKVPFEFPLCQVNKTDIYKYKGQDRKNIL